MGNMRVNMEAWRRYDDRPGDDTKTGDVTFLLGCLEEAYEDMDFAIHSLEKMIASAPHKTKRNAKLQRIADMLKDTEWEYETSIWDGE